MGDAEVGLSVVLEGDMGRARDDAKRALADLVERTGESLYHYLLMLTADRELARDCAQDAYVRAYEQLHRGRAVNARWLYTVARNRATDEFRRRKREPVEPEGLENMIAPQPIARPEVLRALDRLSPDDREILYLYIVDELPCAEIGSLLQISVNAVRMRVSRARSRFRAIYGERS